MAHSPEAKGRVERVGVQVYAPPKGQKGGQEVRWKSGTEPEVLAWRERMETEEGRTSAVEMRPDVAVYVPVRWAHRSINIGDEPLISFCVYPGDAGHDYGTIETEGFRKRIVEIDGKPAVIDNTQ